MEANTEQRVHKNESKIDMIIYDHRMQAHVLHPGESFTDETLTGDDRKNLDIKFIRLIRTANELEEMKKDRFFSFIVSRDPDIKEAVDAKERELKERELSGKKPKAFTKAKDVLEKILEKTEAE